MSLTHVDPHVSEIVMVWIQSGDLLMVWIQISLKNKICITSIRHELVFCLLLLVTGIIFLTNLILLAPSNHE
jgi:hypothetical protein